MTLGLGYFLMFVGALSIFSVQFWVSLTGVMIGAAVALLSEDQLADLRSGTSVLRVDYGAGEIMGGVIQPVPEPAPLALLSLAAAVGACVLRKR